MNLYKYITPERTDILKNKKIRFSQPGSLNDPFELRPHILAQREDLDPDEVVRSNVLEEQLKEAYKQLSNVLPAAYHSFREFRNDFEDQMDSAKDLVVANNKFRGPGPSRRQFTKEVVDFFDSRFGILSLTEDPKNFLMWSHYSDEHRGFVIEFDTDCDFFNGRGNGIGEPRKVTYSDERPEVYWEPSGLTDKELERHYVDNFLLTKSKQWCYEEEWRVIKRLDDSDETRQVDCGPSVPIKLFEVPPEAISSVIFGVRTSRDKKKEINELVSKSPFEHVNVYESSIHEKEYKIVIDWQMDITSHYT